MIRVNATGREIWLRLACLTVSVGLHAGLGALGWQGLASLPVDAGPITVALVEMAPTASMPAASSAPASSGSKAPVARRPLPRPSVAPAKASSVPVQPVEPLCVVPEAAVVEALAETAAGSLTSDSFLPAGDEGMTARDSLASGGSGSERGTADEEGGRKGSESGGGMIRATPRYESNPLPNYPRLARQNRWEGTVRLRARVTAGGTVEGVSLERSSGHAVLDSSALAGVQRWRFIPATRGGVPVACEVSIPVAFRLTE
ncbi:MAG: energy transducer TonB [Desulfuromonadales bacterium]